MKCSLLLNDIENRNNLYKCVEKINAKFKHFSHVFLMKTEELLKDLKKYHTVIKVLKLKFCNESL